MWKDQHRKGSIIMTEMEHQMDHETHIHTQDVEQELTTSVKISKYY